MFRQILLSPAAYNNSIMTEEEISTPTPAQVPAQQERKTVSTGAQVITLVFGIVSLIAGAVVLITTAAVKIEEVPRMILFWCGWGCLLVEIILTFIFSSRKYKPSKLVAVAGFCGLAAAIMMLISAFLRN